MWSKVLKISKWFFGILLSLMLLITLLLFIFEDDIKKYALGEINNYLAKEVAVKEIDLSFWSSFPSMSLDFDEVLVYDKFDTIVLQDTTLYAELMRLKFNPFDLFRENYAVQEVEFLNGQLNLRTLEDGKINYGILKEKDTTIVSSSEFQFQLEEMVFKNVDFLYDNRSSGQFYDANIADLNLTGAFTEKNFDLKATSQLLVETIRSKNMLLVAGRNAQFDLTISMNTLENIFQIKNSNVAIENLPFHLDGKVSPDSIQFSLNSKDLALADVVNNIKAAELNTIRKVNGQGTFWFDLEIASERKEDSKTEIKADFGIDNGSLKSPEANLSMNNISMNGGYYSNGDAKKEKLNLKKLNFSTAGGSFESKLTVSHFNAPHIRGNAKGFLDLRTIHQLFGPFGFQNLGGNADVQSSFDFQMNNPRFNPADITIEKIKGSIDLKNVLAQLQNDTRIFQQINGKCVIRNQEAGLSDITVKVGKSDLAINGKIQNIVDFYLKKKNLKVEATATSNKFYVEDIQAESIEESKSTEFGWLLPTNINGNIALSLNDVYYGGHTYSSISTRMNFAKRQLKFLQLTGTNGGAKMDGTLFISEEKPSVLLVSAKLASNSIKFGPLFKEWNNFDQNVITAKNIEGKATVEMDFYAPFDLRSGIVKKDIVASIDMEIVNGKLKNVATFKEITQSLRETSAKLVLSKSRINQFEKSLLNLEFKTLSNQIIIKNGMVTIPRMTIGSNALDVVASGTHTFDNQVDYRFDFRFRDLQNKSNQSEFGEIVDDGLGFRVYLRMLGDLYDPEFSWDKEMKKKDRQEERQEAVTDAKSILKTTFGINKKDTTIQEYIPVEKPKEEIKIQFKSDSLNNDPVIPEKEHKKWNALKNKMKEWEKENKKESEFEIDQ